jgi:hypothetical protein
MKEIELIDRFGKYLDQKGYQYKREFRRGTYHNEGYIDIVIYYHKKFIAIEAKMNNFQKVYYQAVSNSIFCDFSYILFPKTPSAKSLQVLENSCVGLIIPQGDNSFHIIKRAASFSLKDHTRTKRNWLQNRAGRLFTALEIPPDYDLDKLERLKPTYEWTKLEDRKLKLGQKFMDDFLGEKEGR